MIQANYRRAHIEKGVKRRHKRKYKTHTNGNKYQLKAIKFIIFEKILDFVGRSNRITAP